MTSTLGSESAVSMRLTISSSDTPSTADTDIPSYCPTAPLKRCASSAVNSETLAPAGESASPKVTMPATLKSAGALWESTLTLEPTRRLPFFAVPRSITTSPALLGEFPATSLYALRRPGFQMNPKLGAPRPGLPIASPFASTTCA